MHMIPVFKSHFSIGKSILRISQSNKNSEGILEIAKEEKMDKVFLIEDTLTGFLEAAKTFEENDIQLVFGLRLTACDSHKSESKKDCHKVVVFAKNAEGCKLLNKIYSQAFTGEYPSIELAELKSLWQEENVRLAIPFYDSFIYNNLMTFASCAPSFDFTKPFFFIEKNNLPFDSLLEKKVNEYCSQKNFQTQLVKSIYYKNKIDFEAYQTYKLICNRGGWSGKNVSLEKPNLEHCASKEFCVQSWKEFNERKLT